MNFFHRQVNFALHIGTKQNSFSIKFRLYMKSVKIKEKSIIFSSLKFAYGNKILLAKVTGLAFVAFLFNQAMLS